MATATETFADEVRAETDAYLDAVTDCVALLPEALDRYGAPAFAETAQRLYERESAADAHLRTLRELIGELAPPNYTDVYLRTGDVMRLYARIDEVPDAAEGFVRDLETVEPTLSDPVKSDFHEMATVTVTATETLAEVTDAYVADLVSDGEATSLTDDIERIATLESEADGHRQAAVERVFSREATTGALLVRDLAESLDCAADAAEEAADHLLFMQGARN
jgi:uncharacterized protein Yka (UPF0111/DUF47 family)